jgi:hypothetical protein
VDKNNEFTLYFLYIIMKGEIFYMFYNKNEIKFIPVGKAKDLTG